MIAVTYATSGLPLRLTAWLFVAGVLDARGQTIAVFYAQGTGIGGVAGPLLFSVLIGSGARIDITGGYVFGALLMPIAAFVAWRWGFAAEGRSLEDCAAPLSSVPASASASQAGFQRNR